MKLPQWNIISKNKIKVTWDNPIDDEFEYRIIPVYSYKNNDGKLMNRRDYNYWNAHEVILDKEAIIDIDFIMRNALGSINEFSSKKIFFPNQLLRHFI